MNKKTIILLSAIGASTLLVGGTFAAWAITDHADPFGIRVSTSEITSDSTNYVTLEWGENASANIGALKMGEKRLAAAVELKATVANKEAYTGKFSYTIKQSNNLEAANRLIDKLVVDVYEDADVTGEIAGTATIADGKQAVEMTPVALKEENQVATRGAYKNIQVLSKDDLQGAHKYKVVISLGDLNDVAVYDALANDVVNIEFDWGMKDGEDVVTSKQYYVKGLEGQAYAYAWHDQMKNAAWPGVKMEAVAGENDIYTISLGSEYDNIIFATGSFNGEEFTTAKQTVNLTPDETATNTLFTIGNQVAEGENAGKYEGAWSKFEPTPETEKGFYLLGEKLFIGENAQGKAVTWNANADTKLTLDEQDHTQFTVYTPGNAKFKVLDSTAGTWYGEASIEDGAPDFTLGDEGKYTIDFYKNKNNEGKYIVAAKIEQQEEEPEEPETPKTFADFKVIYGANDEATTWGYENGKAGTVSSTQLPENVVEQIHFEMTFEEGDMFKLWDGTKNDHYFGAKCLEEGVEGMQHRTQEQINGDIDPNIKVLKAGTYDIYFKHWENGGHSIWAGAKA